MTFQEGWYWIGNPRMKHGSARPVRALQGEAWPGRAWQGAASLGTARRVRAWQGAAHRGMARHFHFNPLETYE